jgi:hypothetical protein
MYGRGLVTDCAKGDFFSRVVFVIIESRAARTSKDEAFAIVDCEPAGDRQRRRTLATSPEALADLERFWRKGLGRRRVVRTLAA